MGTPPSAWCAASSSAKSCPPSRIGRCTSMPELVQGLVSIVVPIYNVEAFLRDCLESIRSQTYRNLEVVMVDDGCTDGSPAIAAEFAAADPRFRLIRQANAGLS